MLDDNQKKEIKTLIQEETRRLFDQPNAVKRSIKQRHLEAELIFRGLAADRPDGSTEVKSYFATDTEVFSLWNGTAWRTYALIPTSPQTYAASNVTTDRTYDADTVVVAELADIVGTLIVDLRTIGLVT